MFAPVSVSVPVPVLVSDSVADPFWIVPEKVVLVLLPPVVSVSVVDAPESVIRPAPAIEPTPTELPARSTVAPLATVTAEFDPNAVVDPACNVPALTVVAPV